jgi:uncharacterized membrane protein YeaQ/YmgE (transglycosylase-associated protein family)
MHATDYVTGIVFGAIVGILARLTLPGRQNIGVFVTLLIGIAAAVLGTLIAKVFNVDDKLRVDLWGLKWSWAVLAIQVGVAIVGIGLAQGLTHTFLAEEGSPKRRTRRRRRRD